MNIKPIKTENNYNQALERPITIFDAKLNSPEEMNQKYLVF